MKYRLLGLGILLFCICLFVSGCGANGLLKEAQVDFNGYQPYGTAKVSNRSRLAVMKQVALYEGQKAKVDQKTLKSVITNATNISDLSSELKFIRAQGTTAEISHEQDYFNHMAATRLSLNRVSKLKNGQQVQLTLVDHSDKPYFKTVTKKFKVKHLKNQQKITRFKASDFKFKAVGTSGHGQIKIYYQAHGRNQAVTQLFMKANQTVRNGNQLTATTNQLAQKLNDGGRYQYRGQAGQTVTIKVVGLKKNPVQMTNLKAVDQAIKAKGAKYIADYEPKVAKDYVQFATSRLVHAYLDGDQAYFIYRTTNNRYITLDYAVSIERQAIIYRSDEKTEGGKSLATVINNDNHNVVERAEDTVEINPYQENTQNNQNIIDFKL